MRGPFIAFIINCALYILHQAVGRFFRRKRISLLDWETKALKRRQDNQSVSSKFSKKNCFFLKSGARFILLRAISRYIKCSILIRFLVDFPGTLLADCDSFRSAWSPTCPNVSCFYYNDFNFIFSFSCYWFAFFINRDCCREDRGTVRALISNTSEIQAIQV